MARNLLRISRGFLSSPSCPVSAIVPTASRRLTLRVPPVATAVIARSFFSSSFVRHQETQLDPNAKPVQLTWIDPKGGRKTVTAYEGQHLLEVAHKYEIDLEGACEGSCACSTCHVILPDKLFHELPEASDDENDMLDMAFGLTETSRLGCQVTITKSFEGAEIRLPAATRNMMVDKTGKTS